MDFQEAVCHPFYRKKFFFFLYQKSAFADHFPHDVKLFLGWLNWFWKLTDKVDVKNSSDIGLKTITTNIIP